MLLPFTISRHVLSARRCSLCSMWTTSCRSAGNRIGFYAQLTARFQCKPVQWLEPRQPIDYLGLTIHQEDAYTWICMEAYIKNTCVILNMENCLPMAVPFSGSMTDQRELCADRKVWMVCDSPWHGSVAEQVCKARYWLCHVTNCTACG